MDKYPKNSLLAKLSSLSIINQQSQSNQYSQLIAICHLAFELWHFSFCLQPFPWGLEKTRSLPLKHIFSTNPSFTSPPIQNWICSRSYCPVVA